MALTVGTNSYVSVEDADAYFEDRIYSDKWETSLVKDKALIAACQIIETSCSPYGNPTVADQALIFPVDGNELPPEDIKIAQYEIAYAVIENEAASFTAQEATLESLKAGSVELVFKGMNQSVSLLINNVAKSKLRKYGRCTFGDETIQVAPLSR